MFYISPQKFLLYFSTRLEQGVVKVNLHPLFRLYNWILSDILPCIWDFRLGIRVADGFRGHICLFIYDKLLIVKLKFIIFFCDKVFLF